jgi:hypothetical protein
MPIVRPQPVYVEPVHSNANAQRRIFLENEIMKLQCHIQDDEITLTKMAGILRIQFAREIDDTKALQAKLQRELASFPAD